MRDVFEMPTWDADEMTAEAWEERCSEFWSEFADRAAGVAWRARTEIAERVARGIAEAAEWAAKNDGCVTLDGLQDAESETLDCALIYTSDIMAAWAAYDWPEPSEMSDTVHGSIVFAVAEEVASLGLPGEILALLEDLALGVF